MQPLKKLLVLLTAFAALTPCAATAGVVINEIFYNAPDDLDDLQWVEFHNASDRPADVSDWTLDGGGVARALPPEGGRGRRGRSLRPRGT